MTKWIKTSICLIGIGIGVGVITCIVRVFNRKKVEEKIREVPNRTKRVIKIPKHVVGLVLGRGGATIKDIRQKTKAKITFEDTDNDFTVATLIGYEEEVEEAVVHINKIITGRPLMSTKELFIPNKFFDLFIGNNGDNIRCICHESRAKITTDWTPSKDNSTSLKVIIKGRKEEVDAAVEIIDKMFADAEVQSNNLVHVAGRALPEKPLSRKENFSVPREKLIASSSNDYLEIFASAAESPSRFWVQICGPKATQLDKLTAGMTDFYDDRKNKTKYELKEVKVNDIVAAYYTDDELWYRARVQNVHQGNDSADTTVDIFYVDFGDCATVSQDKIREIKEEYLSIPFQAIECCLSKVEPTGDSWSKEAISLFEKLVKLAQWKVVLAMPVEASENNAKEKSSDSPQLVSLFDTSTESDIDIGAELVSSGLARYI